MPAVVQAATALPLRVRAAAGPGLATDTSSIAVTTCPTGMATAARGPVHSTATDTISTPPRSACAPPCRDRLRRANQSATTTPARFEARIQASTTGCGHPMSTVCQATFWNVRNCSTSAGPKIRHGAPQDTRAAAWPMGDDAHAGDAIASRDHCAATRTAVTTCASVPLAQERSIVPNAPLTAVSIDRPSSSATAVCGPLSAAPAPGSDRSMSGSAHRNITVPAIDRAKSTGSDDENCSAIRRRPRPPRMTGTPKRRSSIPCATGARKPRANTARPMTPTSTELSSLICTRLTDSATTSRRRNCRPNTHVSAPSKVAASDDCPRPDAGMRSRPPRSLIAVR